MTTVTWIMVALVLLFGRSTHTQIMSYDTVQPPDVFNNTPAIDIHHRCKAFVEAFGLAASSYMHCAILHSRPFNFCSMCTKEYVVAMNLYTKLKTEKDDSHPPKSCEQVSLSGDKIMLVTQAHEFVKQSWKASYCDNCFEDNCIDHEWGNGTVNCTASNHTLVFHELYTGANLCLQNFTNSTQPFIASGDDVTESLGCTICKDKYNQLNEFYVESEHKYEGMLCMDIVDAMNYTRQTWSKTLLCTHTKGDVAAIVSLTCFFCLLPIVFYVSSKLHGEREEKKLLKQKRMKNFNNRSTDEPSNSTSLGT